MSTTDKTRTFITNLFNTISSHGFGKDFLDSLSDSLVWTATGTSPVSGRYTSKQSYIDNVLAKLREQVDLSKTKPSIDHILVDGEWASVVFHTSGVIAVNGADFSMTYSWVMRVEAEKIVEVIGFYDQKKILDIFA